MTRQKAINAKCKECIYDPELRGTWRQQIEACDLNSCTLWPYRPKSRSKLCSVAVQAQNEPLQGVAHAY